MEYSVESLAKLTKVSVRTLHYYDEIDLLKPLIRMANGRRYYGIEQLHRLLEILYFKEMGISLKKIRLMVDAQVKDKSSFLSAQKTVLK
jgi:DNA-binding transcriptional MerR regulator